MIMLIEHYRNSLIIIEDICYHFCLMFFSFWSGIPLPMRNSFVVTILK